MLSEEVSFDAYGRLEPHASITTPVHLKSRNYFKFPELNFDPAANYKMISAVLDIPLSEEAFVSEVNQLMENSINSLRPDNHQNIIAIPFFTPKLVESDIGQVMEEFLIPTVGASYKNRFPEYEFKNEFPHSLSGHFKSLPGLGHDRLESALKSGPVIGICFFILREYSIHAAREQIKILGEEFGLAGAIDLSSAFVAQPDLLFHKDHYPPMIWMSGCQTSWEHANFHYEAYGYNLMFNRRVHYDQVAEYWSHGITCFKGL